MTYRDYRSENQRNEKDAHIDIKKILVRSRTGFEPYGYEPYEQECQGKQS